MLERGFKRTRSLPENQDQFKQFAIQQAEGILSDAGVDDPQDDVSVSMSETNGGGTTEKSEFIFDHNLFIYFPERGGTVVMKKDGRRVNLTITGNSVFEILARNAGRVVRFREFGQIWENLSPAEFGNSLKKQISAIRHSIKDEKVGNQFSILKTEFGVGYFLSGTQDPQKENQFSNRGLSDTQGGKSDIVIYENKQDTDSTEGLNKESVYRHSSGFIYNPERNSVSIDTEENFLTNTQKRLLEFLIFNENKALSYEKIAQALWTDEESLLDEYLGRQVIRAHVKNLRRKVKDKKVEGKNEFSIIKNLTGWGYMLVEPAKLQSAAPTQLSV